MVQLNENFESICTTISTLKANKLNKQFIIPQYLTLLNYKVIFFFFVNCSSKADGAYLVS